MATVAPEPNVAQGDWRITLKKQDSNVVIDTVVIKAVSGVTHSMAESADLIDL
jgi:hypothetical protein